VDAPTGAARWFNQLDKEFSIGTDSRVQAIDISSMNSDDLYRWWVRNTSPGHAVISDNRKALLRQIKATSSHSEVIVVDCWGKVRFQRSEALDEDAYGDLKAAVDSALYDVVCPTSDTTTP
jgi:hypothetical protein